MSNFSNFFSSFFISFEREKISFQRHIISFKRETVEQDFIPPSSLHSYVRLYAWWLVIWTDCPWHDFYMISIAGLRNHESTNYSHGPNGPNWNTPYLAWDMENNKLTLKISHFIPYQPTGNRTRVASVIC